MKAAAAIQQKEAARPKLESRALAKGLVLLQTLSRKSPASLATLAASVELGKASTLRLLHTLETTGFVFRDEAGNYSAAPRHYGAAESLQVSVLIAAAREEMERLNTDLAETVSLAVLRDDHIRVVYTLESPQHIRLSNHLNRILPPYASSLGKAISAWQTPETLHLLLQAYGIYRTTGNTITDPILIREEMARIRERGYSREYEETVPGGCCFGAPIRVRSRPVTASISVSMPAARLSPQSEKLIPDALRKAASRISRKLERSST